MATKCSNRLPLIEAIISRKSKENPSHAISFQFKTFEWIETPDTGQAGAKIS